MLGYLLWIKKKDGFDIVIWKEKETDRVIPSFYPLRVTLSIKLLFSILRWILYSKIVICCWANHCSSNGCHSNGYHSNVCHSNGYHSSGYHSSGYHSNGYHSELVMVTIVTVALATQLWCEDYIPIKFMVKWWFFLFDIYTYYTVDGVDVWCHRK